jgi:hypothetical protein
MINKQTEQELVGKEMEIVAAGQRGDLGAIAPLLAEEFLEIGSSGQLHSRAAVLRAMSEVKIVDCVFGDFRALPVNDNCVILTYTTTMRRSSEGQEFFQRAYRSSTWSRRDGCWRVVFHQATRLPPAG